MSETEWSIVASAVSIALAVFAIVLSLVFFRWSSKASDNTNQAAALIKQSVEHLQRETFSTLTTTLDRVLPPASDRAEAEHRVAEQVEGITKGYEERFAEVTNRLEIADETASELRAELRQAVGGAFEESRKIADAERQRDLRRDVLFLMVPGGRYIREYFSGGLEKRGYTGDEIVQAIDHLIAEGELSTFQYGNQVGITRAPIST